MRRPLLARAGFGLAALLLLALPACGSDNPIAPLFEEDISGTYTLETVAGAEVPLVFSETADLTVELLGGSVLLEADGSFQEVLLFRETPPGGEAEALEFVTEGTYRIEGGTLVFQSPEATWPAAYLDGVITYVIWDVPFQFRQ